MEHKTYHGRPVIWSPQPRQAAFMARTEDEALYGGAAGGGKSDALIIEALRQVHIPHYRALILRKTYPQLSELIDKTMRYYKPVFPKARYNGSSHCWTFPSGAKIYFGSLNHTQDKYNYQGKAFDFIGVDELTHFTWDEYSYVMSRNRPSGPGTRVYIRATANPGGVGHGWVKARFISPAPAGTRMVQLVKVKAPDGEEITRRRTRIFIPSTVFDNPALLENDPGYIGTLASLPEAEKQALLYGNWDSFSGQVFTEWRNDPNHYKDQRWTHVIEPFPIPEHWKIWRGYDFGFSKPFSVGWYAADERGRLYRIKELYGCTGTPNEGLRKDPMEQARMIREAEENDPLLKGGSSWAWPTRPSSTRAGARASRTCRRKVRTFCTGCPATTPVWRERCSFTIGWLSAKTAGRCCRSSTPASTSSAPSRTSSMTRAMWRTSTPPRRITSTTSAGMC